MYYVAYVCLAFKRIHPDFFVKPDFEIAIDLKTRACEQTFKSVPDSGCPPLPAGQPRQYLVNFVSILAQFWQITLTCSKPCFG